MSSLFCLASLLWQNTQFWIFVQRVDLKCLWYSLTLKPCVVSAFWDQLPFCSINKHAWKSSTKHQIQQAVKTGCKQKAKQEIMRRIMHIKCCDKPVIYNLYIIILQLLKTRKLVQHSIGSFRQCTGTLFPELKRKRCRFARPTLFFFVFF